MTLPRITLSAATPYPRLLLVAGTAALAIGLSACSISNSISDSISSPFKWSSDSSKSSSQRQSYEADVRDYTDAYVRSSSDVQSFRNGLASVAKKHGVSNWEADQSTYKGIGEGLAKANVNQTQLEVYKTNLSGGDPAKAAAIEKGYRQYKD